MIGSVDIRLSTQDADNLVAAVRNGAFRGARILTVTTIPNGASGARSEVSVAPTGSEELLTAVRRGIYGVFELRIPLETDGIVEVPVESARHRDMAVAMRRISNGPPKATNRNPQVMAFILSPWFLLGFPLFLYFGALHYWPVETLGWTIVIVACIFIVRNPGTAILLVVAFIFGATRGGKK